MVSLLNPLLYPLVEINALFAVAVISLVVVIIISLAQKFMTNQAVMKEVRADMKKLQKKMKEAKSSPNKLLEIQNQLLEKNKIYMMQSFKPMLVTLIPVGIILAWLTAHLAFMPIMPADEFTVRAAFPLELTGEATLSVPSGLELVTQQTVPLEIGVDTSPWFSDKSVRVAQWNIRAQELGEYTINFSYENKNVSQRLLVSDDPEYATPRLSHDDVFLFTQIDNQKLVLWDLGFYQLGGFGIYIILSIVFSLIVRRLMGLH